MMSVFDLKSAILGGLVGLLLAIAFGASAGSRIDFVSRFQLQTSDSHAFVLDTMTGQVWEYSVTTEGQKAERFFEPKPRPRYN